MRPHQDLSFAHFVETCLADEAITPRQAAVYFMRTGLQWSWGRIALACRTARSTLRDEYAKACAVLQPPRRQNPPLDEGTA